MPELARRLAVARGDEPADLVIRGTRVFSVFTREWLDGDLAIADGFVAGLGDYEGTEVLELSGRYLVPGFVDAHMHLESSKLLVDEFARLVLPLGTTAVVADPHEIANVLGTDGVHWLLDACDEVPLDVYVMASSCVPASRFESPRRELTPGDLEGLLRRRRVIGLDGASHVDGHAPGVLGKQLNAYAASGIRSDHEAYSAEEGRQRLRAGMWLLIREASAARNLEALLPVVREFGPARIAFCTDDREPEHIVDEGHINSMVRASVAQGIAPEDALVMASRNGASWHGLSHLGGIAPGHQADLLLLPDLERFEPELVLKRGRRLDEIDRPTVPEWVKHTVRAAPTTTADFALSSGGGRVRVIGVVPDQIVTESLVEEAAVRDGQVVADVERDLAKIVVVERHLGTGRIGRGLVRGFGMRDGALASTIAHDAHNIVAVGMNDDDLQRAVKQLVELGGGIVVVSQGGVLAELPLPVAGLLSDRPLAEVVAASRACVEAARGLGCTLPSPFQSLAFLALSVIPSLKITDHGLVDVDAFELVPLEV